MKRLGNIVLVSSQRMDLVLQSLMSRSSYTCITWQLHSAIWCYRSGDGCREGSHDLSGTEEPPIFGVLTAAPETQANPRYAVHTSGSSHLAIDSAQIAKSLKTHVILYVLHIIHGTNLGRDLCEMMSENAGICWHMKQQMISNEMEELQEGGYIIICFSIVLHALYWQWG